MIFLRTRPGIRTPKLRALNAAPLPVGLSGHEWSASVSNRSRQACKARLRTSAHPMRASGESRTRYLREPPAGLELAAFRLQGGRSTCRAAAAKYPRTRFARATHDMSARGLYQLGYRGMTYGGPPVPWPTMSDLGGTVLAAVGVFAGTDIDDLVVLTVLFLSARAAGKPRPWQIWAGQYVGITALVAISAAAALGLTVIPNEWVGLVGVVPIGLGVFGLVRAIRARGADETPPAAVATGLVSVAAVTIANGADNISVYTPLFRTIGPTRTLVTVAVFAVGVAVWCLVGSWLGSHKAVVRLIERWGHWIVPIVFIAIGTVIVIESGVVGRLAG